MKPFSLILLATGLLFPVTGLIAQSEETASFRLMAVVGSFSDLKFDSADGVITPVIGQRPGTLYPRPLAGTLALFRELPAPAESPPGSPPVRVPVANIPIPATRRSLVLLASTPGGGVVYHVIDDDPSRHPAGTLKVWNLSQFPLAQALNREMIQVPPGQSGSIAVSEREDLIQVAVFKDDKWKTAYRREMKLSPYYRYYALVFDYIKDPETPPDPLPPPASVRFFYERSQP